MAGNGGREGTSWGQATEVRRLVGAGHRFRAAPNPSQLTAPGKDTKKLPLPPSTSCQPHPFVKEIILLKDKGYPISEDRSVNELHHLGTSGLTLYPGPSCWPQQGPRPLWLQREKRGGRQMLSKLPLLPARPPVPCQPHATSRDLILLMGSCIPCTALGTQ